ncbi:gamma-glutamylcyclotransferase family protein [Paremcibacter congregatus]|uniref:gamma-glutamylcyclotransferase family protein n=1 Tax=Paremcibacter congregatus TaxID=2043170 RepID=UPI003A918AF6|tara:strand:+ start:4294 stop:4701 length:408 start_codon:yes stop_codon:yes gene_type:complete
MIVFFYGLFMEEELLIAKNIAPVNKGLAVLPGYALRIGDRATLLPDPAGVCHGVLMDISPSEADDLYGEGSVADYVPETVQVQTREGQTVSALCYNLPADKISGHNAAYATHLLKLAEKLGLPQDYLTQIRAFTE